tara:strand:+ start:16368 stop:16553 length:186 start_codon:yes stop_codon:yes gene_type:complete
MEKELNKILDKLKEANTTQDNQLIDKHLNELNKLWEKNSQEIIENGKKDGFHLPKTTRNEN